MFAKAINSYQTKTVLCVTVQSLEKAFSLEPSQLGSLYRYKCPSKTTHLPPQHNAKHFNGCYIWVTRSLLATIMIFYFIVGQNYVQNQIDDNLVLRFWQSVKWDDLNRKKNTDVTKATQRHFTPECVCVCVCMILCTLH